MTPRFGDRINIYATDMMRDLITMLDVTIFANYSKDNARIHWRWYYPYRDDVHEHTTSCLWGEAIPELQALVRLLK